MRNEEEKKIRILIGLAEVFGFNLTEAAMDIYLSALEEISADAVSRLATMGVKKNAWKFMPKPGEILELIEMPRDKDRKLKARSAFMTLLDDARRGRVPNTEDQSTSMALKSIGGFSQIKMCTDIGLQWLEKRFIESYELASESKEKFLDAEGIKYPELTSTNKNGGDLIKELQGKMKSIP